MNSLEMPLMIPRTALVFTLVAVAVLLPTPALAAPPHRDGGKWVRVFDDEFDGASLDATKWSSGLPDGLMLGGPPYLDSARVRVKDGRLIITATREAHPNAPKASGPRRRRYSRDFTSGAVHTKGKFGSTRGYAEARLKMPRTRGTSPAFWMLPAAGGWLPEIDVVEVPLARTRMYCTYHYEGAKGARSWSRRFDVPDMSAGFHDYGVGWTEDYLAFYFDGKELGRCKNRRAIAQAKDMYLILSLVAGGWAGEPTADAPFPTSLESDWVRVWQWQ